jgi:DNA-binding NarL/FixJ family response regulator
MATVERLPVAARRLRVLLVTEREAVDAVFQGLPGNPLVTRVAPVAGLVRRAVVAAASVAVVDTSPDEAGALSVCAELNEQRPGLPLVALVCCPHAMDGAQLRALADAGIGSILDLHSGPEEITHLLEGAVAGDLVLHLRVGNGHAALWRDLLAGRRHGGGAAELSEHDLKLLELLTLGLCDHEMGRALCLSPHTVKHRVEQLRRKLGVRNRIALAAWAGKHGLVPADEAAESAGVAIA